MSNAAQHPTQSESIRAQPNKSSSSAKAGDPVRRGLSAQSLMSLGYWDRPVKPGDDMGVRASAKTVIASQRVRAKRGPMTGSAKQSIAQQLRKQEWVASSQALLAMTLRHGG